LELLLNRPTLPRDTFCIQSCLWRKDDSEHQDNFFDPTPVAFGESHFGTWSFGQFTTSKRIPEITMELLIHISAPTTKKDDDRYRAQALAYLDFKPAVKHACEKVVPTPAEEKSALAFVPEELGRLRQEKREDSSQHPHTEVNIRKRKTPSYVVPPVLTATDGSVDGHMSTPLEKLEIMQALWKSRQVASSPQHAPPGEDIPDTQRLFSTQFAMAALETQIYSYSSDSGYVPDSFLLQERASKQQRTSQQTWAVAPASSNSDSSHSSVLYTRLSDAPVTERDAADHITNQPDLLSSQLPDTYDLSKSDEDDSVLTPVQKGHLQSHSASSNKTHVHLTPNSKDSNSVKSAGGKSFQVYSSAVDNKSSAETRRWSSQPLPINSEKENIQTSPFIKHSRHLPTHQPPEDTPKRKQTPIQLPRSSIPSPLPPSLLQQLFSLPKQVLPPMPPTSHTPAAEATFVDSTLEKLASVTELQKRFHARHQQLRPISKFERGYWRLDTRGWPLHHQILFWQKMMRFVGNGVAGLATSCFRQTEEEEESLGIVKVFCWGEIVMHVYLFLYSCGRKEMRKQSATWVDVDGKVAVSISAVPDS
jgi:hypothetical protein